MTEPAVLKYAVISSDPVPSLDSPFPDDLRALSRHQLTRWLDIKRDEGWTWDDEPEFIERVVPQGRYHVTYHPAMMVRVQWAHRPGASHD